MVVNKEASRKEGENNRLISVKEYCRPGMFGFIPFGRAFEII